MDLDLNNLSPEQLRQLKAQLGIADTDPTGRSPMRPRQLHDLRLMPTKDDPRPTFFWSAEAPRNAADLTKTTPYPRLLFAADGTDITVYDEKEHKAKLKDGYYETSPVQKPLDPMEALTAQLNAMSPEDRALVLENQKKQRMDTITSQVANLSTAELETLLKAAKDEATGRKAKTA